MVAVHHLLIELPLQRDPLGQIGGVGDGVKGIDESGKAVAEGDLILGQRLILTGEDIDGVVELIGEGGDLIHGGGDAPQGVGQRLTGAAKGAQTGDDLERHLIRDLLYPPLNLGRYLVLREAGEGEAAGGGKVGQHRIGITPQGVAHGTEPVGDEAEGGVQLRGELIVQPCSDGAGAVAMKPAAIGALLLGAAAADSAAAVGEIQP